MVTISTIILAVSWSGPASMLHRHAAAARSPAAEHRARACVVAADATSFDYLVLGGGSGGIASARRAAAHGASVAVIERARLGGTCVNVGCVPKKVMFNAATIAEMIHQASGYGYTVGSCSFDLPTLKKKRDDYVARLNGIYRNNLKNSDVTFIEGDAKFVGPKLVAVGEETYTAKNILIAVGGTPMVPDIPGAEGCITSDGFFDLEQVPKKIAVVGSGYIAVELAGILNVLGSEVDLIIRGGMPLRSMDKDVVSMLVTEMKEAGINLIDSTECASITTDSEGSKTILCTKGNEFAGYDEVLFATGRVPVTATLDLPAAGVDMAPGGTIVVDEASRTSAPDVYAVGDVIGKIDLTPVAIAAGRLLSDRLFAGKPESETLMDYDNVPTVVFSHPTLAVTGLTEEEAAAKYGSDAITVHKTTFVNMLYSREFLVEDQFQPKTMAKLICVGPEQRIVGLHMIGLATDEILQGFGVAIKMGATKADFDSVVAIHPTSAEELVTIPPWQAKYKNAVPKAEPEKAAVPA